MDWWYINVFFSLSFSERLIFFESKWWADNVEDWDVFSKGLGGVEDFRFYGVQVREKKPIPESKFSKKNRW